MIFLFYFVGFVSSIGKAQNVSDTGEVCIELESLGTVCGMQIAPPIEGGVPVNVFTGIPYAKPPMGHSRFAFPEPIETFRENPLKANIVSPSCPQKVGDDGDFGLAQNSSIQEDCLYLNIWSPAVLPEERAPNGLAVMFWIYGGAFSMGSISTDLYSGDVVASRGKVIFVSVNYRLGPFGFAYLSDKYGGIPPNLGLMDQREGMRWVSKHIRAFGGDPNRVTIFGESAGSMSVTAHLASPGSAPLFSRAIAQSGSMASPLTAVGLEALENRTLAIARSLGCPLNETTVNCLKSKRDISLLLSATPPLSLFPAADDESFFGTGSAREMLYGRQPLTSVLNKTVLIGFNADEYTLLMWLSNMTRFALDTKWNMSKDEYINSIGFMLTFFPPALDPVLLKAVLWQYDQPKYGASYAYRYAQFMSDFEFACGSSETARAIAKTSDAGAVYLYLFNETIPTENGLGWSQLRACHGCELNYIFGSPLRTSQPELLPEFNFGDTPTEDQEITMITFSEQMLDRWTNFAKTGKPILSDPTTSNMTRQWDPVSPKGDKLNYFVLQSRTNLPSQVTNIKKEECDLWARIEQISKYHPCEE